MKKTAAILATLLLLTALYSCKQEKKEEAEIVKITIPAVEFLTVSEEEIAQNSAEQGHYAYTIEKDGSVTYTTTKTSRQARLAYDKAAVDSIISEILASEKTAITDIKYNEDMTELSICIKGETFTAAEKLAPTVLLFPHMSSYQYFSLYNNAKITATFIDSDSGEVIDSATYKEYLSFFDSASNGEKLPRNNFFTKATN